jgi:hypothetical protein
MGRCMLVLSHGIVTGVVSIQIDLYILSLISQVGRVIGLGPELRKFISDQRLQISFSIFGKSSGVNSRRFKSLVHPTQHRLWDSKKSETLANNENPTEFIPVRRRTAGKSRKDLESLQLDEETTDEYQSSCSEPEGKQQPVVLPAEQLINRDFEAKLSNNPSCISSWLTFLNFNLNNSSNSGGNHNLKATIAVSILQRALKASPCNINSFTLWNSYLFWGEELWDESKLDTEWVRALECVSDDRIWLEWLNWRLRASRIGIYKTLLTDGRKCFLSMKNDYIKLIAFWRVLVAFQEAGD